MAELTTIKGHLNKAMRLATATINNRMSDKELSTKVSGSLSRYFKALGYEAKVEGAYFVIKGKEAKYYFFFGIYGAGDYEIEFDHQTRL